MDSKERIKKKERRNGRHTTTLEPEMATEATAAKVATEVTMAKVAMEATVMTMMVATTCFIERDLKEKVAEEFSCFEGDFEEEGNQVPNLSE